MGQVRASHILVPTKVQITGIETCVKNGENFAELARANSTCPSKANGGDLGVFTRGMMVEPFENVAFNLNIGEVSAPVQTQFGWHLIQRTG